MLELSDTQAEIIRVFLDKYRDESNNISEGIAGNKLEEFGIVAKTFRNNRDYFLKNYFLRLSKVEYHGHRNYFYFQITRLGVLAYLKWLSKKSSQDVSLDKDFFSLLWKYWGNLVDIFGDILFDVLQKTIDRIEIRPQWILQIQDEQVYGGKLIETILVPLGTIDVKLYREYDSPQLQSLPEADAWKSTELFPSLNQEIDNKITSRFTFLLFFNLINSGSDSSEITTLMFPNRVRLFDFKKETLTDDDKEQKKLEIKKFIEKMEQNTDKLFSIILADKDLHDLMKSTVTEITESLNNRRSLKIMADKLGLSS